MNGIISRLFVCLAAACLGGTVAYNVKNCQQALCEFDVPPECQQWRNVKCDFQNNPEKQINLTATSFPANVREIFIYNAKQVTVQENALKSLKFLKEIRFETVETLDVLRNSMARDRLPNRITLMVSSVKTLKLHPKTFSGWETTKSKITIKNIETCHIMGSTFPSDTQIASVRLENIKSLTAESRAFAGTIEEVFLEQVTMETCDYATFGGIIKSLTLSQVTMEIAKGGCVSASAGWQELRVVACNINRIESEGIAGMIQDIVIEGSEISVVATEGLSVRCSSLAMYQNNIGELARNAMNIGAEKSVEVNGLTIKVLRSHGFDPIIMWSREGSAIFANIYLTQAEEESLAFAKPVNVVVRDIVFNKPCTCDTVKHAKLAIGKATKPFDIKNDPNERTKLVSSKVHCLGENGRPMPIVSYHGEHCPHPLDSATSSSDSTFTTTDSSNGNVHATDGDGGSDANRDGSSHGSSATSALLYFIITCLVLIMLVAVIISLQLLRPEAITWVWRQVGGGLGYNSASIFQRYTSRENACRSSVLGDEAQGWGCPSPTPPGSDHPYEEINQETPVNPRYDSMHSGRQTSQESKVPDHGDHATAAKTMTQAGISSDKGTEEPSDQETSDPSDIPSETSDPHQNKSEKPDPRDSPRDMDSTGLRRRV